MLCQLCKYLETCVRSDYGGPAGQLMAGVEVIQHTLQRLSGSYDNTPGAKWQRTARKDLVREGMSLQGGAAQEWSNFFALSCILFVWKPSNSDHHLHLIRLVLYFRTSKMTFQCVFQNQVTPMFFAIIANVAIAHLSLWARMIYESMTCFWVGARAAVCQTIGWQCYHLSSLCSSSQLDHYQSEFQDTWIPPSMSSYHPLSTPAFCSTFFTSLSLFGNFLPNIWPH